MQASEHSRPNQMAAPGSSTKNEAAEYSTRKTDYSVYFLLVAIAGFFLAWIPMLPARAFDPDEFQHSHAAWCVFRGMLPYKDFFEHHTPWYYYALAPFYRWFSVDLSFESARHFLIFGRALSAVLAAVSVLAVVRIGRTWEHRQLGLLAGLFLVGQPVFFEKAVEIRPDVLALPLYLGGLAFLLRGLASSADSAPRRIVRFLAAGLAIGGAIMSTQKMLFVLPGLLAGLCIWTLFAGPRTLTRALAVAGCLAGIVVPVGLTWAAFALHHGGRQFFHNNFALNASWKQVIGEQLLKVLATSWPVLILCLLGCCAALYRFVRAKQRNYDAVVLLSTLLGLIAGILVVPAAHRQYYLMILPIVCLFAAKGFLLLVDLAQERARAWLLVAATIPLFVLPVLALREAFMQRNDGQLARLRYVFQNTKPTDVVMDGWEGTGVFRPHGFYYYFIHEELLPMLARERVDAYLDALGSGRIRPRLIALDENLTNLGSRFVRLVKRNYVTHDGFFYFSKPSSQ